MDNNTKETSMSPRTDAWSPVSVKSVRFDPGIVIFLKIDISHFNIILIKKCQINVAMYTIFVIGK